MTMNTITVYETNNFQGLSRTYTADVPDLAEKHFADCISSAKVVGQPWLMYEHPNYEGLFLALEDGEHPILPMNDTASSLKMITEDLNSPKITVYEEPNASGKHTVLTEETNLMFGNVNDKISSHRVQSGAWLLYEGANREGRCIVARAGEYLANYHDVSLKDQLSHAYPLRPGKGSVTATIQWDKKKVESEKNIQADQYIYSNNTDSEQQFTATSCKEYEKYISHTFEFSNETSIWVGASFDLGVVNIESEVSNTFSVRRDEVEALTTRKKAELSVPMKVPPRTKITISFMSKEVKISVPVELKITRGCQTVSEYGTYHCDSGTDIYIEVTSDPVSK